MTKTNMSEVQDEHLHRKKHLQIDEASPAADSNRTYDIVSKMHVNEIITVP